ncbi:hypothetical protein NUKP71_47750 [Klebsiella quasipneumoniae]|nr:hypothetical protein NUKP71_47750 [Klebsiella quasipneumoniae]
MFLLVGGNVFKFFRCGGHASYGKFVAITKSSKTDLSLEKSQ